VAGAPGRKTGKGPSRAGGAGTPPPNSEGVISGNSNLPDVIEGTGPGAFIRKKLWHRNWPGARVFPGHVSEQRGIPRAELHPVANSIPPWVLAETQPEGTLVGSTVGVGGLWEGPCRKNCPKEGGGPELSGRPAGPRVGRTWKGPGQGRGPPPWWTSPKNPPGPGWAFSKKRDPGGSACSKLKT